MARRHTAHGFAGEEVGLLPFPPLSLPHSTSSPLSVAMASFECFHGTLAVGKTGQSSLTDHGSDLEAAKDCFRKKWVWYTSAIASCLSFHSSCASLFASVPLFPSMCLSFHLFPSMCLSFHPCASLSIHVPLFLSMCLSFHPCASLSIHVPLFPSMCLSFHPCASLSIHVPLFPSMPPGICRFLDKTQNNWEEKDNFVKHPSKYDLVAVDFEAEVHCVCVCM